MLSSLVFFVLICSENTSGSSDDVFNNSFVTCNELCKVKHLGSGRMCFYTFNQGVYMYKKTIICRLNHESVKYMYQVKKGDYMHLHIDMQMHTRIIRSLIITLSSTFILPCQTNVVRNRIFFGQKIGFKHILTRIFGPVCVYKRICGSNTLAFKFCT